jgi:hypothetical protein
MLLLSEGKNPAACGRFAGQENAPARRSFDIFGLFSSLALEVGIAMNGIGGPKQLDPAEWFQRGADGS